jgi:hypothetical protein
LGWREHASANIKSVETDTPSERKEERAKKAETGSLGERNKS